MKLRSIFHILICVLMLTILSGITGACVNDSKVEALLDNADTLVKDYPDSVLAILDSMNEEIMDCPKSQRMRYELLRADAQNKAYVDFTTDSVMKEVVGYYDDQGAANQRMKANYLLGCTYRDMGESPLALEYYQKAVECADTTAEDCDFYNLASVYGQMAELYRKQYLAENALEAYRLYEYASIKNNDSLNAVLSLVYRSSIFQNYYNDKDDSVYILSVRAHQWLLSHNYKSQAAQHVGPLVYYNIKRGNYIMANSYLREYENYSNMVDSLGFVPYYASVYYKLKGELLFQREQYDSLNIYLDRLLKSGRKEYAYRGYLQLYTTLHIPDSMAKYANLYVSAIDSSFLDKSTDDLIRINSMYKYGRMQEESKDNAELYAESQTHKLYLACVILLLFVIVSVVVIAYKKSQKKNVERIKQLAYQLESNKERLNILLEEAEERTVSMIKKEDEIIHLQEQIHSMETILNSTSKDTVTQSFFNTDIYGVIKSKSQYSSNWQSVTDDEWKTLISKFRIYYSDYSSFLSSNNNLTDDQYKVCMLIALNFRESEIALLLGVDSARVNRLKLQINEKLFSKKDSKSLRHNLSKHC